MKKVNYVDGCVVNRFINDKRINALAHCVNCQGKMGTGTAKDIRNNLSGIYTKYNNYLKDNANPLGDALISSVGRDNHIDNNSKVVVNLFGQQYYSRHVRMINYGAIAQSLFISSSELLSLYGESVVIAIPWKMGCNNAGGDWVAIKEIIEWMYRDHYIVYCKK